MRLGAGMEARVALCHAKGFRESKTDIQTPNQSSHRRKTVGWGGPFWEGRARACPPPIPTDLGVGPGLGPQQTHLLPSGLRKAAGP